MMNHNLLINKIKEHFSQIPSLTRDQLRNFYQQFDPDLKESTFNWRIYDLKRKHIIAPIEKMCIPCHQNQFFRHTQERDYKNFIIR